MLTLCNRGFSEDYGLRPGKCSEAAARKGADVKAYGGPYGNALQAVSHGGNVIVE